MILKRVGWCYIHVHRASTWGIHMVLNPFYKIDGGGSFAWDRSISLPLPQYPTDGYLEWEEFTNETRTDANQEESIYRMDPNWICLLKEGRPGTWRERYLSG